ncbi:MAG: hypothetical protein OEW48_13300 [Phycisphaerae bacterium]|nr:hypothetical protein [Phycisphaerae bacterium]
MLRRIIVTAMAACIVAMLLVSQSFSAAGGAGGGGRGGRGQRAPREGAGQTQRDPAEMQRMMTERMKEPLGASDEQWKDIQPRLQKVMNLSRQINASGRGMMFGGPGGLAGRRQPGGPGTADQDAGQRTRPGPGAGRAQTEQSAVGKATQELQDVLSNKEAKPEDIKAKLTALRTAKEKAQKDLATAQKELKEKLTVKQEAILVLSGYLN